MEKLIMLGLADNANDKGLCFPSISTIANKTSTSKTTTIKYTQKLEARGYILSKKRHRKNGSATSKIYLLYPNANPDEKFRQSLEGGQPKQSLKGALEKEGQSLKGVPLKTSPTLFNNHFYKKLSPEEKNLFLEYCSLRKKIKLQTTLKIQVRLLEKYFELGKNIEIIKNAINANWKNFYPIKHNFQEKKPLDQKNKEMINKYFAAYNLDVVEIKELQDA